MNFSKIIFRIVCVLSFLLSICQAQEPIVVKASPYSGVSPATLLDDRKEVVLRHVSSAEVEMYRDLGQFSNGSLEKRLRELRVSTEKAFQAAYIPLPGNIHYVNLERIIVIENELQRRKNGQVEDDNLATKLIRVVTNRRWNSDKKLDAENTVRYRFQGAYNQK